MPVAGQGTLEQYVDKLDAIASAVADVDPEVEDRIRRMVFNLQELNQVTRESLATLIASDPGYVPLLASVVGLSQERLKRQLQALTGSASWVRRARNDPRMLIDLLDDVFGVVGRLAEARSHTYTFADVLIARASRGAGASGAIEAGRKLEDAVEGVIESLALPYDIHTRYVGTAAQSGPADFAVPVGGVQCRIAIGVKGFDSTGSKLTAAYDEVRRMADVRRPDQYIFVVVDGIGWHARKGDLGRLVEMVRTQEIDGMFPQAEFGAFRAALSDAAVRVGILDP